MSKTSYESGCDEERDDDEYCSFCAGSDGNLRQAFHFCFDCGVYGKYICGDCLKNHNKFLKNHETVKITNPSISRRAKENDSNLKALQQLNGELQKDYNTLYKEKAVFERELLECKLAQDLANNRLKAQATEFDRRSTEYNNRISDLIKERDDLISRMKVRDEELNGLKRENLKLKKENSDHEKNVQKLQKGKAKANEEKEKAERDKKMCEQRHKYEISQLLKSKEIQKQELKTMNEIIQQMEKQKTKDGKNHEAQIKALHKIVTNLNEEIKRKELELNNSLYNFQRQSQVDNQNILTLRDQLHNVKGLLQTSQNEVDSLTKDKQDLLLSLSKEAGANLTYDNPNIADLSDEKRPTKLAEAFSELYDNEWTDAFVELEVETEVGKTNFMLDILMETCKVCSDLSMGHTKRIKEGFCKLILTNQIMEKYEVATNAAPTEEENEKQIWEQTENIANDTVKDADTGAKEHNIYKDGLQTDESAENKNTECYQIENDPSKGGNDVLNNLKGHKVEDCDLQTGKSNSEKDTDDTQGKVTEDGTSKEAEDTKNEDTMLRQEICIESDFDLLQKEQKKTIMDAKNFFETSLTKEVKTTVTDLICKAFKIDKEGQDVLVSYIEKCVSICWSMCRHNPPVHVEVPEVTENIQFDTNKYRPYTKSGKYIDYIVWPPLLLHEGGPLLCKGVAQGGKKDKQK